MYKIDIAKTRREVIDEIINKARKQEFFPKNNLFYCWKNSPECVDSKRFDKNTYVCKNEHYTYCQGHDNMKV